MIELSDYLVLGAILFSLGVAGIFLNRKNALVLLMSIELILLAVNFNFIAFSYFLNVGHRPGDPGGAVPQSRHHQRRRSGQHARLTSAGRQGVCRRRPLPGPARATGGEMCKTYTGDGICPGGRMRAPLRRARTVRVAVIPSGTIRHRRSRIAGPHPRRHGDGATVNRA
jgi:hypothetical protein